MAAPIESIARRLARATGIQISTTFNDIHNARNVRLEYSGWTRSPRYTKRQELANRIPQPGSSTKTIQKQTAAKPFPMLSIMQISAQPRTCNVFSPPAWRRSTDPPGRPTSPSPRGKSRMRKQHGRRNHLAPKNVAACSCRRSSKLAAQCVVTTTIGVGTGQGLTTCIRMQCFRRPLVLAIVNLDAIHHGVDYPTARQSRVFIPLLFSIFQWGNWLTQRTCRVHA